MSDAFTAALFYYQFVAIPALLGSAVGLSLVARRRASWRRVAPFPSFWGVFAMYYLLFIVGVGCGVHRYFSHKSYTATRPWKLFLAYLSLLVGQGGPLDWAYVHRIHHRLCEHDLDYHSPFNVDMATHEPGPLGLRGFLYAQAMWLITPHQHVRRSKALERYLTPDIVLDPDLQWYNAFVDGSPLLSKGVCGWILPGFAVAAAHVLWVYGRAYWWRRAATASSAVKDTAAAAAAAAARRRRGAQHRRRCFRRRTAIARRGGHLELLLLRLLLLPARRADMDVDRLCQLRDPPVGRRAL